MERVGLPSGLILLHILLVLALWPPQWVCYHFHCVSFVANGYLEHMDIVERSYSAAMESKAWMCSFESVTSNPQLERVQQRHVVKHETHVTRRRSTEPRQDILFTFTR